MCLACLYHDQSDKLKQITQLTVSDKKKMKGTENNIRQCTSKRNNFETNNTDDETNVENSTQNNGESDLFETTDTNDFNAVAQDPQQATIDQIIQNSKLNHYMNITQLQVDGGIVAVPSMRNDQISIDIKNEMCTIHMMTTWALT